MSSGVFERQADVVQAFEQNMLADTDRFQI